MATADTIVTGDGSVRFGEIVGHPKPYQHVIDLFGVARSASPQLNTKVSAGSRAARGVSAISVFVRERSTSGRWNWIENAGWE